MIRPMVGHPLRTLLPTRNPLGVAVLAILTFAALPAVQAQTFTVLHSFTGGSDGANPEAGLVIDSGGRLYGTTALGGNVNREYCTGTCGTVFALKHAGSGWLLASLYKFNGQDGSSPESPVTLAPDGEVYGTAGLVFSLRPPATPCHSVSCPWSETILYPFCCIFYSAGGLTLDSQGNLYGASQFGGVVNRCSGGLGCGFLYQMSLTGDGWNETNLYVFQAGQDSAHPVGNVIFDGQGNLYATSAGLYGGDGYGAVVELTPSGSGFAERTLYTFPSQIGDQGSFPLAGLIRDASGNLYGATTTGGSGGGGTVFELTPSNGGWNYNLLYSFTGSGYLPGVPASLIMDAAGNLYGVTYIDGLYSQGSVFKLTHSSGGWTYTSVHDFTGGSDGAYPLGSLVMDNSGNLYGTAAAGGNTGSQCSYNYQCGVVFEITR